MSCLTICNAQKLLSIGGDCGLDPTGAIDIEFVKKGTLLLSHVIDWDEGDSYTVYFREPVPTSDIRICGEKVPKGARLYQNSKPTYHKYIQWEASNGQEFAFNAVTIDISSDSPEKIYIDDVIINKRNGEIESCYYCRSSFSQRDSVSRQFESKNIHWEADNGEEFEQFVEISFKNSIKTNYSSFSGKVTFYSANSYIGGTKWASTAGNNSRYRLKLYCPIPSDNFAWKYVTKAGETRYQSINKNATVSILNIDEDITECYIVPYGFGKDSPSEDLEIQEISIQDGSQPKIETLVLWHANGTTTEISLYKKPRVTFSTDKVLIKGSGVNFEYPSKDIVKFTYKKEDIVNEIDAPNNEVNFFRDEEHIVFNGIKSTDEVALYKLNGSRIPVKINISEDNRVTLPLSGIPSGIYILKVNGKTTKITKR